MERLTIRTKGEKMLCILEQNKKEKKNTGDSKTAEKKAALRAIVLYGVLIGANIVLLVLWAIEIF